MSFETTKKEDEGKEEVSNKNKHWKNLILHKKMIEKD